jgi:histidinol-phosphate/aromatic aminotransferase/cobyric acid decarboxylase-like protein
MSKGFGIAGLRAAYLAVSKKLSPYYDKVDLGFEPNYLAIQVSTKLLLNYPWFIEESKISISTIWLNPPYSYGKHFDQS